MQGSIVQTLALAIFGNDQLLGHQRSQFWPGSSVFQFCKRVRFVALDGDPNAPVETAFADDPVNWSAKLRASGVTEFRVHHFASGNENLSDRLSVGFVGGGRRWLIEACNSATSDVWQARWDMGEQDDPEQKIWDIAYFRVAKGTDMSSAPGVDLAGLKHELSDTLDDIEAFAVRQKLDTFAKSFRAAKAALSSNDPLKGTYHTDIAPTQSLSLEAKQLLGSAQLAWVFGGMGSWNDQGFEGQDHQVYEELSDDLYLLLNHAACSAVNSCMQGRR